MAIQVNPIVARKGNFMESFDVDDTDRMFAFIAAAEEAIHRNKISGQRIVYTKIPRWSDKRRFDTYQVFVIPAGIVKPEDEKIDSNYKVKKKRLFHLRLRELGKPFADMTDRVIFSQLTAARLVGGVHTADRLRDADNFLRGLQPDFNITDWLPMRAAGFPPVLEENPSVTIGFLAFIAEHDTLHVEHYGRWFIVHPYEIVHDPFELRPVQVPCFRVGYGCVASVACYDLGGTLPGDLVGVSYRLDGCAFGVLLVHGPVPGFKFFTHTSPGKDLDRSIVAETRLWRLSVIMFISVNNPTLQE